MRRLSIAVFLFASLALYGKPKGDRCIPLKPSEKTRLETYIRKKFKVPPALALKITDAQDQECGFFRKIDISADDPARKFQMILYASPDLRFLTRDLLDTRIDPDIEEKQRQQQFQAGLTSGDFPALGPASAPVTITVFSDFQCPYCAGFAKLLKEVLPRVSPDVRVIFRQFPLAMHPWARPAALASACVAQQSNDGFWKLHDFLFEHQREITPQNLAERIKSETAKLSGFDQERFQGCLADPKTASNVEAEAAFGTSHGVRGTPTVFVNGQRVSVSEPEQLRSVIQEAKSQSNVLAQK